MNAFMLLAGGVAVVWAAGFAAGWNLARRSARYMLGGLSHG
jgi:hypothetical protein